MTQSPNAGPPSSAGPSPSAGSPSGSPPPLSTRLRRLAAAGIALATAYGVYESVYGSTAIAALAVAAIAYLAVTGRS